MKNIPFLIFLYSISFFSQNLIKNGNFEDELNHWSGFNNQVLKDDLINSTVGNVNNGEGSLIQIFTVTPNTTYKFYFNYRWVSVSGNYNMIVRVKTGENNGSNLKTLTLNSTPNQWNQGSIEFETGDSDTTVRVVFF